ncbi:MAG TPA: hypothetical protein VKU85_03220, partial [bacterium]|nr:hypothetical protein [bacterium]
MPKPDRTDLAIVVDFQTTSTDPVTVSFADRFGTPNIHRYLTFLVAAGGSEILSDSGAGEWTVRPSAQRRVRLEYTLSYDPEELKYNTYSPNVSEHHFHVAGCQWALQIGEPDDEHTLRVRMDHAGGWTLYTSLSGTPHDFEVDASFDDLVSSAIGGSRREPHRFTCGGSPVSVFLQGAFDVPEGEMIDAAERIVRSQWRTFGPPDGEFLHVVLLPRLENVAGVRFRNMFVSFLDPEVDRMSLYVLLAHEMLHNWIAGDLITPEDGHEPVRYAWVYEGFTEYLARRMLLDDGLLTAGEFLDLLNRDITAIADNPHGDATYDDLVAARRDGTFGQAFNKLSYYRGAL